MGCRLATVLFSCRGASILGARSSGAFDGRPQHACIQSTNAVEVGRVKMFPVVYSDLVVSGVLNAVNKSHSCMNVTKMACENAALSVRATQSVSSSF
jgi:hypothetical protein